MIVTMKSKQNLCIRSVLLWILSFSLITISLSSKAEDTSSVAVSSTLIQKVEVHGNNNLSTRAVLAYLPSLVGMTYTPLLGNDVIKRLFATKLFIDTAVIFKNGVLQVIVTETRIIGKIAYEGNLYYSDATLASEVGLRTREPFNREYVRATSLQILRLYRLAGRLNAVVTPYTIERSDQRVDIVFKIEEGTRATIAGVASL